VLGGVAGDLVLEHDDDALVVLIEHLTGDHHAVTGLDAQLTIR